MPAAFDLSYFIGQTSVVFVLFLIAAFYPFNWVMRLKEIKALRS
jgi:ABC-type lipoprotein release transport system permease subunit